MISYVKLPLDVLEDMLETYGAGYKHRNAISELIEIRKKEMEQTTDDSRRNNNQDSRCTRCSRSTSSFD